MYGCIDGPTLPSRRLVALLSSCLAFSRLVSPPFGRFAALAVPPPFCVLTA